MAEASSKKETMMRRKDLRGAQAWIGAEESMRSLMVWRLSGRKMAVSRRFVMRRVFEGGVGIDRGGTIERSIDMVLRESLEVGRDEGGEVFEVDIWIASIWIEGSEELECLELYSYSEEEGIGDEERVEK
jgi:hypothetical protein